MKKRYSTPEMEVEAFNIFTVFTNPAQAAVVLTKAVIM